VGLTVLTLRIIIHLTGAIVADVGIHLTGAVAVAVTETETVEIASVTITPAGMVIMVIVELRVEVGISHGVGLGAATVQAQVVGRTLRMFPLLEARPIQTLTRHGGSAGVTAGIMDGRIGETGAIGGLPPDPTTEATVEPT
jgi:hypothetical protein